MPLTLAPVVGHLVLQSRCSGDRGPCSRASSQDPTNLVEMTYEADPRRLPRHLAIREETS